jgi:hypothetical protein
MLEACGRAMADHCGGQYRYFKHCFEASECEEEVRLIARCECNVGGQYCRDKPLTKLASNRAFHCPLWHIRPVAEAPKSANNRLSFVSQIYVFCMLAGRVATNAHNQSEGRVHDVAYVRRCPDDTILFAVQ